MDTPALPPQLRRYLTSSERQKPQRAAYLLPSTAHHPKAFSRHASPTRQLFSSYAVSQPVSDIDRLKAQRFGVPDRVYYNPRTDGREVWRKATDHRAGGESIGLFSTFDTEEAFLYKARLSHAAELEARFWRAQDAQQQQQQEGAGGRL